MDIKNYLIKSSKAEYDERNCAELYVEHEHIEKDMKFNAHVKKRIIEEWNDQKQEQAKIRKQHQWEWEREQEIEVGKQNSDGTLITWKVSCIFVNNVEQSTHKYTVKTCCKGHRWARYKKKTWNNA